MDRWLSIIGIGEDGLAGLTSASRNALGQAEILFGAPRHLAMVAHPDKRPWPVPFDLGPLLALRGGPGRGGKRVAALVSGDPFWHGAGGSLARHLEPGEWQSFPAPSVFSLIANRLGWRLEEVRCLGLHAAPLARLRRVLAPGQRVIVTLRDGEAPAELAAWLCENGFGAARMHLFSRLGGAAEQIGQHRATDPLPRTDSPVACALEIEAGPALPRASGLEDSHFQHDGQITKRPIRALALSALAPRPGELLWDLGTGSGSIAVEWLLCHPANRAHALEKDPDRAARAAENARRLGVGQFTLHQGDSRDLIATLPDPDAVFIGGGLDGPLLEALWTRLPAGVRLVAHAVTLETEALLITAQARHGGHLLRIELANMAPLGRMRGWKSSYPVVQWVVTT